jgi:hypothetical protein
MGHGEEIALSFDASRLPPLASGQRRTFLFFSRGFEKGYSGVTETVEPLPVEDLASGPVTFGPDFDETSHSRYLLEWNTRPSWLRSAPAPQTFPISQGRR